MRFIQERYDIEDFVSQKISQILDEFKGFKGDNATISRGEFNEWIGPAINEEFGDSSITPTGTSEEPIPTPRSIPVPTPRSIPITPRTPISNNPITDIIDTYNLEEIFDYVKEKGNNTDCCTVHLKPENLKNNLQIF